VFDKMEGALLILGEPGSGKTTTLLELARDLIAAPRKIRDYPCQWCSICHRGQSNRRSGKETAIEVRDTANYRGMAGR